MRRAAPSRLTALNDRPGGSISPFWLPATTTSTPHASMRMSIEASDEIVSTISSASVPAASIAPRTSSMRLAQPVEVSFCTTQTALTSGFSASAAPSACGSTPLRQFDWITTGSSPSRVGQPLPQHGEVPGLDHQHPVARRQRVDQRRLPGAGAGGRVDHHLPRLGPDDPLHAVEHAPTQLRELRPAVVDGRPVHGAQHAVGHVRRPGDLQEVPSAAHAALR